MIVVAAPSKVDVFGVGLSVTDYEEATRTILEAAASRTSFGVSALATHGLMEAVHDPSFMDVVRSLDIVTCDGQPVRWAMNLLNDDVNLQDRVYGPDLTWRVCGEAAAAQIPIYLFGSTERTCQAFAESIRTEWPDIQIVGVQPDRFRDATAEEDDADVERMNSSGAGIVLVGRGCPRQERWVAGHLGRVDAAMLAVGAAFDYHAGELRKPPAAMQRYGMEWLWRLLQEPRRMFPRYAVTNTQYVVALTKAIVRSRVRLRGRAAGSASGRS